MRTDLCEPTFRQLTLLATLFVGAVLLWPLPVGGALLMVAASFGLVIAWETDLSAVVIAPASNTHHSGNTPGPGHGH